MSSAAERAAEVLRDPRWGETPEQRVAALMAHPDLLREMADEAEAARPKQPPVIWCDVCGEANHNGNYHRRYLPPWEPTNDH